MLTRSLDNFINNDYERVAWIYTGSAVTQLASDASGQSYVTFLELFTIINSKFPHNKHFQRF